MVASDDKIFPQLMNEKIIMCMIDHPFLCKLHRTFKDDFFVFMLIDHVDGADLYDILKQVGSLDKMKSKVFLACLLLAL